MDKEEKNINEKEAFIEEEKNDNKVVSFLKKYKKPLLAGAVLVTGVLVYLGIKNNEDAEEVIESIGEKLGSKINEAPELEKYSHEWISSLDDKQWKIERDILQDEWCSGTMTYERAVVVEEIMHAFDVIKGERDWAGKPYVGPVHSEHGWYLPSDD